MFFMQFAPNVWYALRKQEHALKPRLDNAVQLKGDNEWFN